MSQVSWLPPQHPRAKITVSAEKLQSNLVNVSSGGGAGMGAAGEGIGGLNSLDRRKPVSVSIREASGSRKKKSAERLDELDPMDPAAYSEASVIIN